MDAQQALQQGIGAVHSLPPGLDESAGTSGANDELAVLKQQLDEEQMRSLQLQCVLDAKDRELTLVRQHISSGESQSDTLLQALQRENEALRRRLTETRAALQAAKDTLPQLRPSSPPTHQRPVTTNNSTSSSSDWQHLDVPPAPQSIVPGAKWPQQPKQRARMQQDAAAAGTSAASHADSCNDEPDEVLVLNVSGVEMHALRSTLMLVPGSHLYQMFRRHSKLAPPWDDKRRFFLPIKASAFGMVLEALQAQQLLGIEPRARDWLHSSSADYNHVQPLLKFLGLHEHFDQSQGAVGTSNGLTAAAAQPRFQTANAAGAAATKNGTRQPQSNNVERASPVPSAAAMQASVPEAVAAALRPRANVEVGAEGGAPAALDATQVALAGLKVPNMYEVMAKKAASGGM